MRLSSLPLPIAASLLTLPLTAARAQSPMTIEDYQPRSSLVVPGNPKIRAKYPFVDVHSHHGRPTPGQADTLVSEMDRMNMAVMVNLSGGSGQRLADGVRALKGKHPSRFVVFANVDFSLINDPEFGPKAADQLGRDYLAGARGLKIFKNLGMDVKDASSQRVAVDDPRLDPIWAKAGELKIPVLIHTADPAQFWDPMDQSNERWLELKEVPGRIRPPDRYPPWETIMREQWTIIRRHPKTNFISAHLSWLGGDLGRLGRLLDSLPNMNVEIGAVLAELGRQPRFAREWLTRYQDRVLFGKDAWQPSEYLVYFRVMETADEYFDYYRRRHGLWKLYGMDLPDPVLKKLYYGNALRLIPGLDRSLFPR
jgi:predicted TIM-barrel fold metal-dependent hydrolase